MDRGTWIEMEVYEVRLQEGVEIDRRRDRQMEIDGSMSSPYRVCIQ